MQGYFVTGTDTGVGKTLIACGIARSWTRRGLRVGVMKPVASGCRRGPEGLRNEDAEALMAAARIPAEHYRQVNPYALEPPMAPHIAARRANTAIDIPLIRSLMLAQYGHCARMIVEGIGGWRVPLNEQAEVADLALALGLPVLLVVGLRLGCINHAMLSAAAIRGSGVPLAGWVSTVVDPDYPGEEETIATLREAMDSPHLAHVPWLAADREARVMALLAQVRMLRH